MYLTSGIGPALQLASAQHDLLTTADLRAQGLDYRQIDLLARDGITERVIRGLYRIAGSRTRRQDMAAALSRHRGAALSHLSALELRSMPARRPRSPHLTLAPGRTSVCRLGTLHRSPLAETQVTTIDGLRVTTLARSIVDSAEYLRVGEIRQLLDLSIGDARVEVDEILEAIWHVERSPGRIGLGRLRMALAPWTEEIQPESVAEAAALRLIVTAGFPVPATQYEIVGDAGVVIARVDLAWPAFRIAREYDSRRWHGAPRIEADERRRQQVEAAGWSIGVLHRGHLVPGREDWLADLRTDLRAAGFAG